MDEEAFRRFLKRGGRSDRAAGRVVRLVREFQAYLGDQADGRGLDEARPEDLERFVAWIERAPKASAKGHLWALRTYFEYTSQEELRRLAGELRQGRITRKPFALKGFRGVNQEVVARLAAVGIGNVAQMLEAGRTAADRQALAEKAGVPLDAVLELVKLSDLARLGAVKSVRARLYHDAGVDTVEKMARWDPEALRAMLIAFVERTGFDGIAPLPKEARNAVAAARRLPKIVEY
jgi:hypothetical protein